MKALQRQLKDRNVRTRQGCFTLLTELAGVLPSSLVEHMPVLVSGRLGCSWLAVTWAASRPPILNPQSLRAHIIFLGLPCVMIAHGGSSPTTERTRLFPSLR